MGPAAGPECHKCLETLATKALKHRCFGTSAGAVSVTLTEHVSACASWGRRGGAGRRKKEGRRRRGLRRRRKVN